jgi:hypothetical protein
VLEAVVPVLAVLVFVADEVVVVTDGEVVVLVALVEVVVLVPNC